MLIDAVCKPANVIDGWDAHLAAIFRDYTPLFHQGSVPVDCAECRRCGREFSIAKNLWDECCHSGSWHSDFSQCNFRCTKGLVLNGLQGTTVKLGQQHWSCCFSAEFDSTCSLSERHISRAGFAPPGCDASGFEIVSLFDDFSAELKKNFSEQAGILMERLEQYRVKNVKRPQAPMGLTFMKMLVPWPELSSKHGSRMLCTRLQQQLGPSSQGSASRQHRVLQ